MRKQHRASWHISAKAIMFAPYARITSWNPDFFGAIVCERFGLTENGKIQESRRRSFQASLKSFPAMVGILQSGRVNVMRVLATGQEGGTGVYKQE